MKTDHVVALVRAAMAGNNEHMMSMVSQMEAAAASSGKHGVASQLRALLNSRSARMVALPANVSGCVRVEPTRRLDDLILSDEVRGSLDRVVKERMFTSQLQDHGLPPRNKILFWGPPGNGKTAAAEAVANAIDCPLLVADYSQLIDSHIGETEKELRKMFDEASNGPCVLLLDECDTLLEVRCEIRAAAGKSYNNATNYMLTRMDRLPVNVLLVAATNRVTQIDGAAKRRFDSTLEFPSPTKAQIDAMRKRLIAKFPVLGSVSACLEVDANSYAELELAMIDMARTEVINQAIAV